VCDRQDDVGTISVLDVTVLIITVCDIPVFHRMAQTEVIRILTTSSESFCRHSELICTDPDGNSAASQNLFASYGMLSNGFFAAMTLVYRR
jgi:hypothetical protein